MQTVTIHVQSDGYLTGAERGEHFNERFWQGQHGPQCRIELIEVSHRLSRLLESQGTSDQYFSDGYEAYQAALAAITGIKATQECEEGESA